MSQGKWGWASSQTISWSVGPYDQTCSSLHLSLEYLDLFGNCKAMHVWNYIVQTTTTTTTTTILQLSGYCQGLPGWADTRRNIHPLISILIINPNLSASSIYCDPWHNPCSIYVPHSFSAQPLSKSSLVYLLVLHPPLHTPYISSPNHCLLFAAYAHIITMLYLEL